MLINFIFGYYGYNNFLKGKQKIGWYMIRGKIWTFYTKQVNNNISFNKVCLYLLNDIMLNKKI